MKPPILEIKNLSVPVAGKPVLQQVDLTLQSGSVYWLLGPNGSGKTSLAFAIMGHPRYTYSSGDLLLDGSSITAMPADERARRGIFMTMQQPVDLPGVTVYALLKEAYRARKGAIFSMNEFDVLVTKAARQLALELPLLQRPMQGLSGGQKKKLELLQLLVLTPRLVILDEVEAGLDHDALAHAGNALATYRHDHPETVFVVISHQERLAQYLPADTVYLMQKGTIVCAGDATIITQVAAKGFDAVTR